ncbi:MAG: LPXTG cell wall anchor domain-containing protein [Firmicutes bacterium]|nr:LPXTG cell wall anchor domain-containing protein [Bacillota bacterium]
MENSQKTNKKKHAVWLLALVLLVSVAATTICVVNILNNYLMDDEGAIGLVPEDLGDAEEFVKTPGYEISADGKTWGTTTEIKIFQVSYENGEKEITVESQDGTQLIAPGTENSYTFKLKNTGNVPLDFEVDIDAFFTPGNLEAEVEGRLSRYDGKWVVGEADRYGEMEELDSGLDNTSLGVGRYAYYTLDWQWPFEDGNDELDTYLGTEAVNTEITFTIRIKTTSTISTDEDCQMGLLPKTGDNSDVVLWIAVGMFAFAGMIFLYFRKEDEEESSY